jgi:hypothetical protein
MTSLVSFLFPANPPGRPLHLLASTVFPLLQLGVTVGSPRSHALQWNLEGLVTNAAQVARPMRAYHRLVMHPMSPGEDQVDFYHALIDTTHFVHSESETISHMQLKSKHYLPARQFELLTSLPRPLHGGCTDLEMISNTEGGIIPFRDIGESST